MTLFFTNLCHNLSAPNIIADIRELDSTSAVKFEIKSDGGDKCKRSSGCAYGGVCRSLRLTGGCHVRLVLGRLALIFGRREDIFTFNLHYKEMLHILYF